MLKKLLVVLLALSLIGTPALAGCPATWNDPNLTCITTQNWHDFVNNWTFWNASTWSNFNNYDTLAQANARNVSIWNNFGNYATVTNVSSANTSIWNNFQNYETVANASAMNASIWYALGNVSAPVDYTGLFFQNGTRIMTGSLNAGGYNISNVSGPVVSTDAATKGYSDLSILTAESVISGWIQSNNSATLATADSHIASNVSTVGTWIAQNNSATLATSDAHISSNMSQVLHLTGGTMTGRINAGGYNLSNVGAPISSGDAVNLNYYSSNLPTTNYVINSNFDIWQRGTSANINASSSGSLLADRWYYSTGGVANISQQSSTAPDGSQYYIRVNRFTGTSYTTANKLLYAGLETQDATKLANKTVTLSFKARAGSGYSATSNNLGVVITSGTGTDENYGTNGAYTTGSSVLSSTNVVLSTSWQTYSVTVTEPSTETETSFHFSETPTGTAGSNDYFEVSQVKLEIGSVATPYVPPEISCELASCMRYFVLYGNTGSGYIISVSSTHRRAGYIDTHMFFSSPMRAIPTLTTSNPTWVSTFPSGNTLSVNDNVDANYLTINGTLSFSTFYGTRYGAIFSCDATTSFSGTVGNTVSVFLGPTAWFAFSAEL